MIPEQYFSNFKDIEVRELVEKLYKTARFSASPNNFLAAIVHLTPLFPSEQGAFQALYLVESGLIQQSKKRGTATIISTKQYFSDSSKAKQNCETCPDEKAMKEFEDALHKGYLNTNKKTPILENATEAKVEDSENQYHNEDDINVENDVPENPPFKLPDELYKTDPPITAVFGDITTVEQLEKYFGLGEQEDAQVVQMVRDFAAGQNITIPGTLKRPQSLIAFLFEKMFSPQTNAEPDNE